MPLREFLAALRPRSRLLYTFSMRSIRRREDVILDISNYLQRGLFVSGPVTTKRQFLNLFGQQLVPGIAVEASAVVAASIGVVAGASWPDRTRRLLVVAPGFDLSDVVRNVAQQVRTGLQATGPVPQDLWAVANVDKKSLEGWVTLVGAGILCGGAFFRGAAWGLSEPSADKVAESWVAGVNSDWSVAAESGLAVDRQPPMAGYDAWRQMVDELLNAYEQGIPFQQAAGMTPRPVLLELWRFEFFRLGLAFQPRR